MRRAAWPATADGPVAVDLAAGRARGAAGADALVGIERVLGSAHADRFHLLEVEVAFVHGVLNASSQALNDQIRSAGCLGADFGGADLSGADLTGADLTGAENLTQEQIDSAARGSAATQLPAGLRQPAPWE